MRDSYVELIATVVNGKLKDGIRYSYFPRDTTGAASVVKYDAHGDLGMVAVGTPRECWQFLRGLDEALTTVNR